MEIESIKKLSILILILINFIYADMDMESYKNYKKTEHYKKFSAQPDNELITNMHAEYYKEENILKLGVTLPKIESLTGRWAEIGAIAKGNHQNFAYIALIPTLVGAKGEKLYEYPQIRSKIMFENENKVNFNTPIKENIKFNSIIILTDLIFDNNQSDNTEKKSIGENTREHKEGEKQLLSTSESPDIKTLLNETKMEKVHKHEEIRNTSPKAFNLLGNELGKFQNSCRYFQKISSLPTQIKKHCEDYISNADKAFTEGYKLDPYIDTDKLNEKQLNIYLELLRRLDDKKSNILHLILLEKEKARKNNDFMYYSQLIANPSIDLFHIDYEFMKKNIGTFGKNERYLSHQQYLKDLEEAEQADIKPEMNIKEIPRVKTNHSQIQKNMPQSYSGNKTLLGYVDLVSGSAYVKDGVLSLNIFYTHRDTDKQVYWKNETAYISCNAYINSGDFLYPAKGFKIGNITNKYITNALQDIYIDIDRSLAGRDGMIECTLNTGYNTFTFTETFLLR